MPSTRSKTSPRRTVGTSPRPNSAASRSPARIGYEVSERLSVWGMAGYGEGELRLPEGTRTVRTDIDMVMTTGGVRRELKRVEGMEVAVAARLATRHRTDGSLLTGSAGPFHAVRTDIDDPAVRRSDQRSVIRRLRPP